MLKAIFYARFHPERGQSVIHQHPNGAVIKSTTSTTPPLISFSDISAYIIPPYELCNRPFSICTKGHRVLGFPVSLEDPKYERNRFTFSTCFVVDERDDDGQAWGPIVRKTAGFFTSLENEDGLLSAEETLPGLKWAGEEDYPVPDVGIIYPLLESIARDLNAYHETCVRVSEQHVLNLRFEGNTKPQPPAVQSWDVPLLVCSLPAPEQWTWNLTLQRIHPHIDGVKHIALIATLADVELKRVKRAVRELIYHDRAILLDIFHFQAIYAVTPAFSLFAQDDDMQEECLHYIAIDPADNPFATAAAAADKPATSRTTEQQHITTKETLLTLYTSLTPGLNVHDFLLTHQAKLNAIDIRRFITFGVIKGFLRRIHKYALAISPATAASFRTSKTSGGSGSGGSGGNSKVRPSPDAVRRASDRAWRKAALSSGWATPPMDAPVPTTAVSRGVALGGVEEEDEEKMRGSCYLDGKHCLDEVCVEMRAAGGGGEKAVVERLRRGRAGVGGDVMVFCK